MKDKLLYLTIGILVGVVVMQWTMPSGRATIITDPAGDIVALADHYLVDKNGDIWTHSTQQGWLYVTALPVPVSQAQFIDFNNTPEFHLVDKSGDLWHRISSAPWNNLGKPPIGPTPTSPDTWSTVKDRYKKAD